MQNIKRFANSLINNNTMPPNVQSFLTKYGNQIISDIQIQRDEIPSAIQSFVYNASNQEPYDKLYHLRLNITTNNGVRFILEKNERVNIQIGILQMRQGGSRMDIDRSDIPQNLTINQFIQNTLNKMGNSFYSYNASSNNCQVFVKNLLECNGINNPKYIDFVKQHTQMIFQGNDNLRKFSNSVVDMARIGNTVMQGGAIEDFQNLKVANLRKLLSEFKNLMFIKNYSKLKKAELIAIINTKFDLANGKLQLKVGNHHNPVPIVQNIPQGLACALPVVNNPVVIHNPPVRKKRVEVQNTPFIQPVIQQPIHNPMHVNNNLTDGQKHYVNTVNKIENKEKLKQKHNPMLEKMKKIREYNYQEAMKDFTRIQNAQDKLNNK